MAYAQLHAQVVGLINDAKMLGVSDAKAKTSLLEQLLELSLNRDRALLELVVPALVEFQVDRSAKVRTLVLDSVVRICAATGGAWMPELFDVIRYLSHDASAGVARRALLAATRLFREALRAVAAAPFPLDERRLRLLETLKSVKGRLLTLAGGGGGGGIGGASAAPSVAARLLAIKFMESLILCYSLPEDAGDGLAAGGAKPSSSGAVAASGAASVAHFNLRDIRAAEARTAGALWAASDFEAEGRSLVRRLGELLCDNGGSRSPFATAH